jgi:hydrogenase maturation protein HypF
MPSPTARIVRSPHGHGAGRYFDGIGSLLLGRPTASYEGQIAMELNGVAAASEPRPYPYELDRALPPWTIDLRAMVRGIVHDAVAGQPASVLSARFHDTIVAATAAVVLTGGCFQNPRLAEHLAGNLAGDFSVYLHGRVPPGDGGIALGQAVIAAAMLTGQHGRDGTERSELTRGLHNVLRSARPNRRRERDDSDR